MATPLAPSDLVDLARYPIHRLGSERGQTLLAHCRTEIAAEGGVNLPGFLKPEATEVLAAEAAALLPDAYVKQCRRNVYGIPVDPTWPEDHPGRVVLEGGTCSQIAYDQILEESGLRRLYLWETLIDFVSAALGGTRLYPFADRFQALNIVYASEGGSTPWHFDHNAFSVTLLLAEPEAGGVFEYVPYLKNDQDENLSGVRRIIAGRSDQVRAPERTAGTFTLFCAEHALHRVTPVHGPSTRISAILTYDELPNRSDADESNIRIYGPRVADLLADGRREAAGWARR